MQLSKKEHNFNAKSVEQALATENKFICDLLNTLSLPNRNDDKDTDEEVLNNDTKSQISNSLTKKETTRAKSFSELQQRLEAVTSKKKLNYKEKLVKKGLKNRLKKKKKQDERNAKAKLLRAANKTIKTETQDGVQTTNGHVKNAKPVFNSEGKMVFSKFDFSDLGVKKTQKQEKDPKKILKNIEKQKEKIEELKEAGQIDKAVEIKEKTAWKNALAKAEGQKVKDDPTLLKKTVQRQEQKKRSSKKKWEARQQGVQKAKDDRQKKRTENIDKRKKEKVKNKLKKAAKRGRIIPGY